MLRFLKSWPMRIMAALVLVYTLAQAHQAFAGTPWWRIWMGWFE